MQTLSQRKQAGFTLVEMLVVIAIIGILAGLVTVAAMGALDTAKQVRIKSELDQLDMAFKDFKNKYGAYPPCDLRCSAGGTTYTNEAALRSFVLTAFPRYNISNLYADFVAVGVDVNNFRPDAAIVLWLGGFNPDVTHPFTVVAGVTPTPFFPFEKTRLVSVTINGVSQVVYVPNVGVTTNATPYIYFDHSIGYGSFTSPPTPPTVTIANSVSNAPPFLAYNTAGSAVGAPTPYVQDIQTVGWIAAGTYQFCNPTTFQIISAGQDGQFGTASQSATYPNVRVFPTGFGYDLTQYDLDNVTNFSDKSRLGDSLP